MTDEERRQIAIEAKAEADTEHRIDKLEARVEKLETAITWGLRAIWAAAAYLATQLWSFIAQGGSLK